MRANTNMHTSIDSTHYALSKLWSTRTLQRRESGVCRAIALLSE